MEKHIVELPRRMPIKDNLNIQNNKSSTAIAIPKSKSCDDVTHEQFDPSSFSSSPPNEFMMCLKNRIKTYN